MMDASEGFTFGSFLLFHDGVPIMKKSNQWAGFYMIGISVITELINKMLLIHLLQLRLHVRLDYTDN